ncbi:CorA family divalent cation transporter, partial [Corynebacterium casei]
GIYGMNFDNMPELHLEYGYYISIAFMVITVGAIFWWFRKNNWL